MGDGKNGGRETPEQLRARRLRRIEREFGGDAAAFHRHKRRLQAKSAGRDLIERGTLEQIAARKTELLAQRLEAKRLRRLAWEARPRLTDQERRARRAAYQLERVRRDPRLRIYDRM